MKNQRIFVLLFLYSRRREEAKLKLCTFLGNFLVPNICAGGDSVEYWSSCNTTEHVFSSVLLESTHSSRNRPTEQAWDVGPCFRAGSGTIGGRQILTSAMATSHLWGLQANGSLTRGAKQSESSAIHNCGLTMTHTTKLHHLTTAHVLCRPGGIPKWVIL